MRFWTISFNNEPQSVHKPHSLAFSLISVSPCFLSISAGLLSMFVCKCRLRNGTELGSGLPLAQAILLYQKKRVTGLAHLSLLRNESRERVVYFCNLFQIGPIFVLISHNFLVLFFSFIKFYSPPPNQFWISFCWLKKKEKIKTLAYRQRVLENLNQTKIIPAGQ